MAPSNQKPPPPPRDVKSPSSGVMAQRSDSDTVSTEDIVAKLCTALTQEGDFPTSAKVVSELRNLAGDPNTTANQITEVILREPSLGIRILHIVNSSFYRRSTPIMTVSQAVLRIGMKQLAELCAGLVLLQKFIPAARKDGAFANCLRRAVMTPLLTTTLAAEIQPTKDGKSAQQESGFLAGLFGELGMLLLAFYYPEIYESATKRSNSKKQPIAQSLKEIVGMSPCQLSEQVLETLELPAYYNKVLMQVDEPKPLKEIDASPQEQKVIFFTSQAVFGATEISAVICEGGGKPELDSVLDNLKDKIQLDRKGIELAVSRLPEIFSEHCTSLELDLAPIPTFVSAYKPVKDQPQTADKQTEIIELKSEEVFARYVDEIRTAVENREPTASIITTVMETLTWGLHFDRVLLMLVDGTKRTLRGRMILGKEAVDPKGISRTITQDMVPCDFRAFLQGRPVFHGEAVLPNAWPFTAIPIGFGERSVGVLYADKVGESNPDLTNREQAAVSVLAELLDKSIIANMR
jgi:HD-like signal output (HDOD) protein